MHESYLWDLSILFIYIAAFGITDNLVENLNDDSKLMVFIGILLVGILGVYLGEIHANEEE